MTWLSYYFPSFFRDDSFTSRTISEIITSKGNDKENIGKESFSHLSAFIPRYTGIPTEANTSEDNPAYRNSSLRLPRFRSFTGSPLSPGSTGGDGGMFQFLTDFR